MTKVIKDWINANIFYVLVDGKAAGYIEMFCKTEWKATNANGKFIGWFTTKKQAVAAITV